MQLLIVESPSKCNIIQQYLRKYNVRCIATFGHFREIKSLDDIVFSGDNVQVKFSVIHKQLKYIQSLRSTIQKATEIILATDNDREGEAIAWHVCDMFDLDVEQTKRIIFNEITEKALLHAYENPVTINMNLVQSQMTRQIIDFLIGYKCSPLLWHIENKLSAGRCQTPALRIICENQEQINNSKRETFHRVTGIFTNKNIMFELNKTFLYQNPPNELFSFFENIQHYPHTFRFQTNRKTINPPQPLTTSRLQQEASNMFRFSPKETMDICQALYEKGRITYMRTDSVSYCDLFLENIKMYIENTFGTQYAHNNPCPNKILTHEAIRVTDISLTSDPSHTEKESKMYHFIYNHTLQSCMSPCEMNVLTASVSTCLSHQFEYSCSDPVFWGWMVLSKDSKQQEKSSQHYHYLINMKQESNLDCKKVFTTIGVRDNTLHYSEAKLVNELESLGIGRPSTFASIVETIQSKKYVVKQNIKGEMAEYSNYEYDWNKINETKIMMEYGNEKQKLVLQPIGKQVNDYLKQTVSHIFDYEYTKELEICLDEICLGTRFWKQECIRFFNQLNSIVGSSEINEKQKEKQKEKEKQNKTNKENKLGQWNDKEVTVKRGKFGMYAVYGNESVTLRHLGNRPVENITLKEIEKKLAKKDRSILREINADISIRRGVKGYPNYILVKTTKKPQCISLKEFPDNYETCNERIIIDWLRNQYGI